MRAARTTVITINKIGSIKVVTAEIIFLFHVINWFETFDTDNRARGRVFQPQRPAPAGAKRRGDYQENGEGARTWRWWMGLADILQQDSRT